MGISLAIGRLTHKVLLLFSSYHHVSFSCVVNMCIYYLEVNFLTNNEQSERMPHCITVGYSNRIEIRSQAARHGLAVFIASAVVALKHETSTICQSHKFISIDLTFGVGD